jgi:hypothetical protein
MRTKLVPILATAAAVAVLAALIGNGVAFPQGKSRQSSNPLLGSWTTRITEGPGTPNLPDWYRARVTFTPGGGLVATITDPQLVTGHGAWRRVGKRKFAVTIFLAQFNQQGKFQGTLEAHARLRVGRNTFGSHNYQFELLDPDGKPTGFSGGGTARGTRIGVEPLP